MKLVTFQQAMSVAVEKGRSAMHVEADVPYVLHEVEVESGRAKGGVFSRVQPLPARPVAFDPLSTQVGRCIVPFIGGLGDAISLLPVLASIRAQHPEVLLDVVTTPGPAQVFALSTQVNDILAYPLSESVLATYDHLINLEVVNETSIDPGRPLPDTFAAALGVELTEPAIELSMPAGIEADADDAISLVGLAVGAPESHRSYPAPLMRKLVGLIVERGLCCVLLGDKDSDLTLPVCSPVVTDLRGKTTSVLELAVWLKAMDVVVSHDSFLLHLAGALGRPTIGLFAPTATGHAAPYRSVRAFGSGVECAPCHAVGGDCPLGHDRCIAWDDAPVSPVAVADAVSQLARPVQTRRAASS